MTIDEMQGEINSCEILLRDTDYKCYKFMDGALSAEQYEPTRAQRQAWRDRINELQAAMKQIEA